MGAGYVEAGGAMPQKRQMWVSASAKWGTGVLSGILQSSGEQHGPSTVCEAIKIHSTLMDDRSMEILHFSYIHP